MRTRLPEESLEHLLRQRGHRLLALEPLAGDVGLRRYYRARTGRPEHPTVILAAYPPELRSACERFLVTSRLLSEVGVPVPEVLDADCAEGWMLVEDLGEATLFDRFCGQPDPWRQLRPYYHRAAELIPRIATVSRVEVASLNPPLDDALLRRELRQTWEVFFEPRGLSTDRGPGRRLAAVLDTLCHRLGREPPVPCHRDFMVRNLVPLAAAPAGEGSAPPRLGVLDHQDLRLGPAFYDLASLLNDSLFPPTAVEGEILARHTESDQDRECYQRAAVQRALKAVGTFSRHGSQRHRALIRPTLDRALRHLAALPEAEPLLPDLPSLEEMGPGEHEAI